MRRVKAKLLWAYAVQNGHTRGQYRQMKRAYNNVPRNKREGL